MPPPPKRPLSTMPTPSGDSLSASPASASSTSAFPGGIPRLDSLGTRPRGGAVAATTRRFAPKVVARRTKQERDATAPVAIAQPAPKPATRPERGRGGGRGGRGGGMGRGGRFADAVASAAIGPLAAPSTEIKRSGGYQAYGALRPNTNIDLAAALRGRVKSETPAPSGAENDNRIDMSSNGPVDGEIAQYFPIRLDTETDIQDEPKIKTEPDLDVCNVSVKQEPKSPERARIERRPEHKHKPDEHSVTSDEQKELTKIQRDHSSLAHDIHLVPGDRSAVNDSRLYHIQLPAILPEFTGPCTDDSDDVVIVDGPEEEAVAGPPMGRIGKLRLHKSGKITMKIGDVIMNVARGTENSFLQDVVILDEEQRSLYQVGQITKKLVVSVDLDRLI